MTDEEWNNLHGYNANGWPLQRFVWEGSGYARPPSRQEVYRPEFRLYICDRGADLSPSAKLPASMTKTMRGYYLEHRHYGAGYAVPSADEEPSGIFVADTTERYDVALKKAFSIFMVTYR